MFNLAKSRKIKVPFLALLVVPILLGLTFLIIKNVFWINQGNRTTEKYPNLIRNNNGFSPFLSTPDLTLPPTPTPTITPTPTPKPLTFAQMDSLYGPCVYAPVLMYHHIQSPDQAKTGKNLSLTVFQEVFDQQLEYLRDRGYSPVSMSDLISFFDQRISLPKKPVILTFDDGYDDFANDAFPILRNFGYKATVFLPTGLMENPGYLTWVQIREIADSGLVLFANHTWSHHNVKASKEVIEKEITLADTQLEDHRLNFPKVFSYPYGLSSNFAEGFLVQRGYALAFTTRSGGTLCLKKRLELPRIRVGNASLGAYGL